MGGHQQAGRGERVWLTPLEVVKACGEFDLDPCFGSPRPWDTAAEHYGPDAADGLGGLHAPWKGMVWCNPPYDRQAWAWLSKCADHGNAIALIFARTEVEQFHRQVWEKAHGLLFLEGRITFHYADGRRAAANGGAPSVLVAYGSEALDRLRNCGMRGRLVVLDERG
tara:strand:- start:3249 stop:3749 length:501 start_codon:yes stop_codon:yes gene_type:complete